MRFLLDENIPPSLATLLKIAGHEARHVVEIGYTSTPDFKSPHLPPKVEK